MSEYYSHKCDDKNACPFLEVEIADLLFYGPVVNRYFCCVDGKTFKEGDDCLNRICNYVEYKGFKDCSKYLSKI